MMTAGDDPGFDAFLAFLHDDNATGKPSQHASSPSVKNNQSVHRISSHPAPPPHSNIDRPRIVNRRQSTHSSNGEKTTIAHKNTTTTSTITINANNEARMVLQKGGTTNNHPTMQNGRLFDFSNSPTIVVSHNNNKSRGGGSSRSRRSFTAPVIIELDNKWKDHHNVLQGLQHSGGGNNNKTKGIKNKKGGLLSRFDRMFHPPPVTSTSKILHNYNINIRDDEEIMSNGVSSISSNGSTRSLHSTLLDPLFAKTPPPRCSKRNMEKEQMAFNNPTENDEYSLQYSLLPLEDTSELVFDEVAAECNIRESTTKEDYNDIRNGLVELFLRGGKGKVDSLLHKSFDDTVVIRGGGGERTRFDEEKDRRRRKPKRSDGREHQLIFI